MGERLGRLKQLVARKSELTGDLVPLHRADARLATHASDHNAYYVGPATEALRQARIEKIDKRQKRAVKKGDSLQVPEHDPPFLHPLSIYHGPEVGSIVKGGVLSQYGWVAVSEHLDPLVLNRSSVVNRALAVETTVTFPVSLGRECTKA